MPHEITMPQLGMAQDSGIIVNWLKNPGDAVQADEILMEVETDKTTMEVEVGHSGFLTEIRAEPGVPVPVGEVIAVISDRPGDRVAIAPEERAVAPTGSLPEKPTQAPPLPAPAEIDAAAPPQPSQEPVAADGASPRILASPKAKFEAHRHGIDLRDLVRSGMKQPLHVADLDRFTPRPAPRDVVEMGMVRTVVERIGFEAFLAWASDKSDGATTPHAVWTAFASGAWRRATTCASARSIVVEYVALSAGGSAIKVVDADQAGIATVELAEAQQEPDLIIRDMTGTLLADHRPGGSIAVPILVLTDSDADAIALSLYFREEDVPLGTAAAALDGIAARVAEPIRHLL